MGISPELAELLAAIPTKTVLRAVREHQQLLEDVHQDARRLALGGAPPAYVVDFDLLRAFMWAEASSDPSAIAETAYLFEHGENFIVGPGTLHELEHSLQALVGERLYEPLADHAFEHRAVVDSFVAEMEERLQSILAARPPGEGIARFNELFRAGRFTLYSTLAGFVDQQAFNEARVYLQERRPGRSRGPMNIADALNYAAVAHLRSVGHALPNPLFPYLLTGTRVVLDLPAVPMLDDDEAEAPPLTRSTRSAIYASVLFASKDPKEAADYTVSKAFDLARVAHDVRTMPTYYNAPPPTQRRRYKAYVNEIAGVFRDPIIDESQKILDNLSLTEGIATGSETQPTARYVLDQVVQLGRLLEMGQTDDEMWTSAFLLDPVKGSDYEGAQAFSKTHDGEREGEWLFECVRYYGSPQHSEPFFVFRWPGRLDAPRILRLFSKSFLRHDVNECRLYVGTEDSKVAYDDVELPFEWHEVVEALSTSARWVRASSEPFDLYADLWTPLTRDPVVGVFTTEPNPDHIAMLFQESGSRFIFAGWSRAMFRKAIDQTGIAVISSPAAVDFI